MCDNNIFIKTLKQTWYTVSHKILSGLKNRRYIA